MPEEVEAGIALPDHKIPPELLEKIKEAKNKLERFKNEVLKNFEKYVKAVALLPPPKFPPEELAGKSEEEIKQIKEKLFTLVLIDDTELKELTRSELKEKISSFLEETVKSIDQAISPQLLFLSELWQSCFDGKWEILEPLALAASIYDTGLLAAIKIAEIHKKMILQKFEKYIVCYVLAGSIVQGRATKESDIDVFMVVDDTDVKRMSRAELKDKLRAIVIGMAIEAGEITGIKNKLNIQTYILTEFWEGIREANPVFFTFLRDGIPFYDRGIFMPWKQLLKQGKIKPSMEAIDMYMSVGEQALQRIKFKIRELGIEDLFWAVVTPSQAALMLYGVPPPTPRETIDLMREIFVNKKLLEEKDVVVLKKVIETRKAIEQETKKELSGKELDELLAASEKYLKRIRKLFAQIEKIKSQENLIHVFDSVTSAARDALRAEGVNVELLTKDEEILENFEKKLITTGKIAPKQFRALEEIFQIKKSFLEGKVTKLDMEKARKLSMDFIREVLEHIQRRRIKELEAAKIKIKIGKRFGEVNLLGNAAFIIHDIDAEPKRISKASIAPDGSLLELEDSSIEEFESTLAKVLPRKAILNAALYQSLQRIFGKDMEILL